MSRPKLFGLLVLLVAPALLAAGCGDSNDTTTPATTTTTAAGGSGASITVDLGKPSEFKITTSAASAPAGDVTFVVTNGGSMMHEMVIVPAPAGGAEALKAADGTAKEDGMIAEAEDVEAGQTKTITADLAPGKYILLCNVGQHFSAGMWTEFTVE